MSNPKVFEFAKEIGMTPLALMDKIREWKLPVKSHMAELEPEVLEAIKLKLNEKSSEAQAKKTVAKKKPAATGAEAPVAKAAKAAPAAKTAAPKAMPPKPTTVARPKTTATKAAAPAEPVAVPKAGASVVRRKAKTAEEQKAEAQAAAAAAAAVAATQAASAREEAIVQAPVRALEPEPIAEEVVEKPQEKAAAPPAAPATAAAPVSEADKKAIPAARKKEVSIGHSGVASAAPKRNIIGRMDLSRVSAPAGAQQRGDRPQRAPIGGTQQGGFRSKGNLRTGFVQAAPIPELLPLEDEFGKKRDEKRRNKAGGTAEGAARGPEEEQPQHFDAAEFRKREMVFQPKKKKGTLMRPAMQTQMTTPKASKRVVKVNQTMKVGDLAVELGVKAPELIKVLMKNGVTAAMNTSLDFDTIALIVPDFNFEAQNVFKTAEDVIGETAFGDLKAEAVSRPPVVTVMGHVDHGKTSLLDAIRNTDVAAGEAGGITQHIGAYQVKLENGHVVTFLDTPGHEAFTAMRARGANVTDIAIIVVAADDGVMPQTAEAINHAKAAGVPMIIAVNKIDKPGANPDKIKQQLTEYEVVPEEWGGNAIFVNVSALKKTGIKELLEQVLLVAEVAELKANPKRSGTGTVIEAKLEKGRGPVATLLISDGSVKVGQHLVAGTQIGRVRGLLNDRGERVEEAGPGMPVVVLGLDGTPAAGDRFDIVKDEKAAEEAAAIRKSQAEAAKQTSNKVSLEEIFAKVKQGDVKELAVVLKADVAGSLEAINGMFGKLSTPEVKVRIIHSAVGGITESDVLLASTAKGIVVGFNVRPDGGAANKAKSLGIDVRTYSIVYELIDEMKKAMAGLLTPDIVEKVMGRAEVRNTFNVPKIGTIAGCAVVDGKIQRSNMARLLRDGKIIYEGKISSLKRFKDDAREVASGFECGIGIENFNDVKVGDVIEAFVKEEVARKLTEAPNAEA